MILSIDGGDGDQSYFSKKLSLHSTAADWFNSDTPRGEAWLFKVVGGEHNDEYIALTSRVQASMIEQFRDQKWASVVVHAIKKTGADYSQSLENLNAIGMSFADLIAE